MLRDGILVLADVGVDHILGLLDVPSLLNFSLVSKMSRQASLMLTPFLFNIEASTIAGPCPFTLSRMTRLPHAPPRSPVMPTRSTLELNLTAHDGGMQQVIAALEALASHGHMPLKTLWMSDTRHSIKLMPGLLRSFPAAAAASVVTLAISGDVLSDSQLDGSRFPNVTHLILNYYISSTDDVVRAFPHLTCLRLCTFSLFSLANLPSLSRLVDLRMTDRKSPSDIRTSGRPDLSVLAALTNLTRLELAHMGPLHVFASQPLPGSLLSIRYLSDNPDDEPVDELVSQSALDLLASRTPLLTSLSFDACVKSVIPTAWVHLQHVCVRSSVAIALPGAQTPSGITRMLIRPSNPTNTPMRVFPTQQQMTHLVIAVHDLAYAVHACPHLTHLFVSPANTSASISDTLHGILCEIMSWGMGAWRDLRVLVMMPEASGRSGNRWNLNTNKPPAERRMHAAHGARFLRTLATTGTMECGVTHVTLFQMTRDATEALSALCLMPLLSSVTLVCMDVAIGELLLLAQRPHMRTIELFDVGGVTREDCLVMPPTCQYLFRPLSVLMRAGQGLMM